MQQIAQWRGSEETASSVRQEILERWGEEEANKYDPLKNCFTFKTWLAKGYVVKKGEKAIRSKTIIEKKFDNPEKGKEPDIKKYPKTVYLFYKKQVKKRK